MYARGVLEQDGNPTYHWALIVAPKVETEKTSPAGTRYHVKDSIIAPTGIAPWRYESIILVRPATHLLLVRITIAKVENQAQLERTLASLPIDQSPDFTCNTWVRDAVAELARDGSLGTKMTEWEKIESKAKEYAAAKSRVGRWKDEGDWSIRMPVTYSMIEGKETIL